MREGLDNRVGVDRLGMPRRSNVTGVTDDPRAVVRGGVQLDPNWHIGLPRLADAAPNAARQHALGLAIAPDHVEPAPNWTVESRGQHGTVGNAADRATALRLDGAEALDCPGHRVVRPVQSADRARSALWREADVDAEHGAGRRQGRRHPYAPNTPFNTSRGAPPASPANEPSFSASAAVSNAPSATRASEPPTDSRRTPRSSSWARVSRRFEANRDAIAALYDQRFTRLFELYLAGSEFSFRHLHHMVWQLQLTRHQAAAPLTRDYMSDPAHLPEKVRPLKTPTLSRSLGE